MNEMTDAAPYGVIVESFGLPNEMQLVRCRPARPGEGLHHFTQHPLESRR